MGLELLELPLGDPRMRRFARLPWRLYEGDPNWTPPLDADLLGNRLLGIKGLLTAQHPYHAHAEVTHFLAVREGRDVGRVSASVDRDFNRYHGTKVAFFGFFECERDGEAASVLLDAAACWARARGMEVLRGPGEYGNATHERQGLLVDGFEYPPTVELTHNPPYYAELIESCGFSKAKDYVAYVLDVPDEVPERIVRIADAARCRPDVTTRAADLSKLAHEVALIIEIYNDAWAENWGFLPITPEEADILVESLKPILDPGLVRFAFVSGEPVAVLGALPDPNWALRPRWNRLGDSDAVRLARLMRVRRHIPRVRLMFFGIKHGFRRAGLDALLFQEAMEYGIPRGYRLCETSLLLEDNDLVIRASAFMGGHEYKRWRIYDKAL